METLNTLMLYCPWNMDRGTETMWHYCGCTVQLFIKITLETLTIIDQVLLLFFDFWTINIISSDLKDFTDHIRSPGRSLPPLSPLVSFCPPSWVHWEFWKRLTLTGKHLSGFQPAGFTASGWFVLSFSSLTSQNLWNRFRATRKEKQYSNGFFALSCKFIFWD